MKENTRRIEKPWGYELIWAETDQYVGKILHVHAGEALSVQLHREKDETLHLLSGEIRLRAGSAVDSLAAVDFGPGESVRMRPGTVHSLEAISDAYILEVSTSHLDDVVRLEDRYGRTRVARAS